jgi:hypothetical protein
MAQMSGEYRGNNRGSAPLAVGPNHGTTDLHSLDFAALKKEAGGEELPPAFFRNRPFIQTHPVGLLRVISNLPPLSPCGLSL